MSKNLLKIWSKLKEADKRWEKKTDYEGSVSMEAALISALGCCNLCISEEVLPLLDRKILEEALSCHRSEWGRYMYSALKRIIEDEEKR